MEMLYDPIALHRCVNDPLSKEKTSEYLNRSKSDCDHCVHLVYSAKLMQVLSKFEYEQFIETRLDSSGLKIVSIRFNLVFQLGIDGQLHSLNYAGYSLRPSQHIDQGFYSFCSYFILQSAATRNLKLIVLSGRLLIDDEGRVQCRTKTCDDDERCNETVREDYCYGMHSRFYASDIDSRLYLPCLHAATATLLPEPRHLRTGADIAFALLRECCWVNRPLSVEEMYNVALLSDFCSLSPTLGVLCQELEKSSMQFKFLHQTDDKEVTFLRLNKDISNYYLSKFPSNFHQCVSLWKEEIALGSFFW
jgi:hypothetical protein